MEKSEIQKKLFSLKDEKYRDFHARLIPNVEKSKIIGVRAPDLRKLAKRLEGEEKESFIKLLPHAYYEEDNLHGYIIGEIADFDKCIREIERFLPFVNNWATCDTLRPACFKEHKKELLDKIREWIKSEDEFTVRFAIEMLMVHFLKASFDKSYPKLVASIKSDKYYINMMIAWYFATALSEQWDDTISYITQKQLPIWIHNKTIQKACESYRISKIRKEQLKMYKIKAE